MLLHRFGKIFLAFKVDLLAKRALLQSRTRTSGQFVHHACSVIVVFVSAFVIVERKLVNVNFISQRCRSCTNAVQNSMHAVPVHGQ